MATGVPTPAITIGGVALPSGVTFTDNGDGTGTLAGTPAAATGGHLRDHVDRHELEPGVRPPQAFTLTVTQAAAITSGPRLRSPSAHRAPFTVTTAGFPAPTLVVGGAALPPVAMIDNLDGTATLAGTPVATTGGDICDHVHRHQFDRENGPQAFTLTVRQAPAITSANATTLAVGTPGTFTVTTTGYPFGSEMAISHSGALPSGVTFTDNLNGTARWPARRRPRQAGPIR